MNFKTKQNGMAVLGGSVLFGFLFPSFAKWILLTLVIVGIISWINVRGSA